MVKVILLILFLIPSSALGQWRGYQWQVIDEKDLETYVEWIQGTFSSEKQALEEPYFGHVVISQTLFHKDDSKYWLQVFQGNAGQEPYRERIYIVSQLNDTTIISKTYRFDEQGRGLITQELIYMEGCDSYIHKGVYDNFYGSIIEGTCLGSYAGANYTTSEFRVYENMIVSMERGWTFDGKQKWGPSRGYYYYRKLK